MRSIKDLPILSFFGFGILIFTMIINYYDRIVTDIGLKIILSTFGAILLLFTTLWALVGVIELVSLVKRLNQVKEKNNQGINDSECYHNKVKRLKTSIVINIGYLVSVSLQIIYVISNWQTLNI